jgi:hypothetical protein
MSLRMVRIWLNIWKRKVLGATAIVSPVCVCVCVTVRACGVTMQIYSINKYERILISVVSSRALKATAADQEYDGQELSGWTVYTLSSV